MTTDTVPKQSTVSLKLRGKPVDQTQITIQQIVQQNQAQWLELVAVEPGEEIDDD